MPCIVKLVARNINIVADALKLLKQYCSQDILKMYGNDFVV